MSILSHLLPAVIYSNHGLVYLGITVLGILAHFIKVLVKDIKPMHGEIWQSIKQYWLDNKMTSIASALGGLAGFYTLATTGHTSYLAYFAAGFMSDNILNSMGSGLRSKMTQVRPPPILSLFTKAKAAVLPASRLNMIDEEPTHRHFMDTELGKTTTVAVSPEDHRRIHEGKEPIGHVQPSERGPRTPSNGSKSQVRRKKVQAKKTTTRKKTASKKSTGTKKKTTTRKTTPRKKSTPRKKTAARRTPPRKK